MTCSNSSYILAYIAGERRTSGDARTFAIVAPTYSLFYSEIYYTFYIISYVSGKTGDYPIVGDLSICKN